MVLHGSQMWYNEQPSGPRTTQSKHEGNGGLKGKEGEGREAPKEEGRGRGSRACEHLLLIEYSGRGVVILCYVAKRGLLPM